MLRAPRERQSARKNCARRQNSQDTITENLNATEDDLDKKKANIATMKEMFNKAKAAHEEFAAKHVKVRAESVFSVFSLCIRSYNKGVHAFGTVNMKKCCAAPWR